MMGSQLKSMGFRGVGTILTAWLTINCQATVRPQTLTVLVFTLHTTIRECEPRLLLALLWPILWLQGKHGQPPALSERCQIGLRRTA